MNDLKHRNGSNSPVGKFRLDKENAKVWGVCAGIARYFDIDATLVRIGFVAGTLFFGSLLLVYLIIALIAD